MNKVTTISICAKCSDMCHTALKDADGNTLAQRSDYVPAFMPGEHYGDYVILDIDVATGTIKNWEQPSQETMETWAKDKP